MGLVLGLEVLVWGDPIMIVAFLVFLLTRSTFMLDPYKPLAAGDLYKADAALSSGKPPMRVQVVGADWKWLFIYRDLRIATTGELVFPIDRQLEPDITSMTAMQSFFIPSLGSQIYAMGGMAKTGSIWQPTRRSGSWDRTPSTMAQASISRSSSHGQRRPKTLPPGSTKSVGPARRSTMRPCPS